MTQVLFDMHCVCVCVWVWVCIPYQHTSCTISCYECFDGWIIDYYKVSRISIKIYGLTWFNYWKFEQQTKQIVIHNIFKYSGILGTKFSNECLFVCLNSNLIWIDIIKLFGNNSWKPEKNVYIVFLLYSPHTVYGILC